LREVVVGIDVNEMRTPFIRMHQLRNVDEKYTFFYDESNNFRKVYLKTGGFNISKQDNFVLSGIVVNDIVEDIDLGSLREDLKLQKNVKEIKTKHIGSGNFLDFLNEEKVGVFLDWLEQQELYIHYFNLNVNYWAIVDIIDSLIDEIGDNSLFSYHMMLKSDLYKVAMNEKDAFFDMMRAFEYPNIREENITNFVVWLRSFIKLNSYVLESKRKDLLLSLFQNETLLKKLFFVMGNETNVLINNFLPFYVRTLYIFKNSRHIFDDEKSIEKIMHTFPLYDNGEELNNHLFINSINCNAVQISDLISGLLGKYFTFINELDICDMKTVKNALNQRQLNNLNLLKKVIDRSDDHSNAFFNSVISEDEYIKNDYMLHSIKRI
ncbi:TPA: hypothetical protein I7120_23705, partial [Vibrio vulnificus]|nr:hypothetical protein [Vibrio vulnificus]